MSVLKWNFTKSRKGRIYTDISEPYVLLPLVLEGFKSAGSVDEFIGRMREVERGEVAEFSFVTQSGLEGIVSQQGSEQCDNPKTVITFYWEFAEKPFDRVFILGIDDIVPFLEDYKALLPSTGE